MASPRIETKGRPGSSGLLDGERETRRLQDTPTPGSSLDRSLAPLSWAESPRSTMPSLDENVADPLIGLVVAERYRIVEPLGRGGMGIVYRVEHVRIGKLLAMKLLAGELSASKEVVRRFKQEALTASKLSCPHTVQVFDYGVWQHLTFLVMEFVDGIDLARALRRQGPLPFARLGPLMVQVCTSLAEAHGKGIVHRDIKPENVMLVTNELGVEAAKVVDFGLAKLRENPELNEVTLQGTVVGTPYYMPPEQILGEEVDGRADVYSLGAVMYRTLTGSFPFSATTPMAMFTKHLSEPPPAIERTHPDLGVPKGVSDLVHRCLAKKKQERFQTVEELRDALTSELKALGVPSLRQAAETEREDERRTRRKGGDEQVATREELEAYEASLLRNRYGLWALGALALAAAVGGAAFLALRPGTKFRGVEEEPNDSAAAANPLPLGEAMRGTIGKRLEEKTGDHDVYRLAVPGEGPHVVALRLSALPDFGLCANLYRVGYQQATGQYCTGPLGQQALEVPGLRLEAGEYLVAVAQDRAPPPGGKTAMPVHENISDRYQLTVALVTADGLDVEPNDALEGAQLASAGGELVGSLGFADDVDVLCATRSDVRWVVEDGPRRHGTVLEVVPYQDGSPLPLARVHLTKAQPHASRSRMAADVNGPWRSPDCRAARCCLGLRTARDPWVEADATGPLPDETRYRVRLEPLE